MTKLVCGHYRGLGKEATEEMGLQTFPVNRKWRSAAVFHSLEAATGKTWWPMFEGGCVGEIELIELRLWSVDHRRHAPSQLWPAHRMEQSRYSWKKVIGCKIPISDYYYYNTYKSVLLMMTIVMTMACWYI